MSIDLITLSDAQLVTELQSLPKASLFREHVLQEMGRRVTEEIQQPVSRPAYREYEVSIKTQYHPAESIWIKARSAKDAVSQARRKARIEDWFCLKNDGRVTFTARLA
jgi:hypothetical protein